MGGECVVESKIYREYVCRTCGAVLKLYDNTHLKCGVCKNENPSFFEIVAISKDAEEENKKKLANQYENILAFLSEWVDIPEDYKKLVTVWIIGTYFHKSFSTYPYLFFNAMRGSGKTRLLQIISWLQKNGNGAVLNNPSEPVMFRTASERGLIFDEFESINSVQKHVMREYLNSCYKRGGEVFRMEKQKIDNKEKQVAVGYKLYTPVAMANINGLEEVLKDRSITIILQKSANPAYVKKMEAFNTDPVLQQIKCVLNQLSVDLCSVEYAKKVWEGWNVYIKNAYPTYTTYIHTIQYYTLEYTVQELEMYTQIDKTGIIGRNLELFFPLLITAKLINNSVFEDMLRIAKELDSVKKNTEYTESKDISLIEFVSLQDKYRFEYVFSNQLLREFKEFIGAGGEEDERWINNTWFGSALVRLNLIGKKKRVAKGNLILLAVDKAKNDLLMFKDKSEVET